MSLLRLRRSRFTKALFFFLTFLLLGGGPARAAVVPLTPGIDTRNILVDVTGSPTGVIANPFYTTAAAGGGGSATSATDESVWTAAVSLFNPTGGVFNDSAAALTSGQQGTQRFTPNRAGHVNLRNQAGTEIGTAGAPLRVDPTGSTTQPVSGTVTANQGGQNAGGVASWNVQGAAGSGGVLANPVIVGGQNAGVVKYMSLDANGGINQGGQNAGGAVSWNVQGAASDNTALAGSPLRLGASDATNIQTVRQASATTGTAGTGLLGAAPQGLAVALGSNPSTVTAGQYVSQVTTRGGIPFSLGGHPNIVTFHANYSAAQTNTVVVANTAGTKLVVTGFSITASNANSVNVSAYMGLAQTTMNSTIGTGVFCADPGIAPGSGLVRGNGGGVLGEGADGDQIIFTDSVPTGGSIDLVVSYFSTPS